MRITEFLTEDVIAVDFPPGSVEEIIDRLVLLLENSGKINKPDMVKQSLLGREQVSSTGVGQGLALPHARSTETEQVLISCGICPQGTNFNALDSKPVHIFFCVVAPQAAPGMHLKLLAAITRMMADENVRYRLQNALTPKEVLEIISKSETAKSEYA